jgi:hypothetical protein
MAYFPLIGSHHIAHEPIILIGDNAKVPFLHIPGHQGTGPPVSETIDTLGHMDGAGQSLPWMVWTLLCLCGTGGTLKPQGILVEDTDILCVMSSKIPWYNHRASRE